MFENDFRRKGIDLLIHWVNVRVIGGVDLGVAQEVAVFVGWGAWGWV